MATRLALLGLLIPLLIGCLPPTPVAGKETPEGYLFCFWNVENLFDDHLDNYADSPDKQIDAWFANNPKVLAKKLENLSTLLVSLNGGRGPDILCVAEVEGGRALELLRLALNKQIKDESLHYKNWMIKDVDAGRHICTGVITRLPVGDTRQPDRDRRILEGSVTVEGHKLWLTPSHWTSRITDETGEKRERYANHIYLRFYDLYKKDRGVDWLVCGDFNDEPKDFSVTKVLFASGDPKESAKGGDDPHLFCPQMGKDSAKYGTHYYRGKFYMFDQIVLSPGMLDGKGWSCDPDSFEVVRKSVDEKGRPDRFGDERDRINLEQRGWSDHLPVTMRFRVTK